MVSIVMEYNVMEYIVWIDNHLYRFTPPADMTDATTYKFEDASGEAWLLLECRRLPPGASEPQPEAAVAEALEQGRSYLGQTDLGRRMRAAGPRSAPVGAVSGFQASLEAGSANAEVRTHLAAAYFRPEFYVRLTYVISQAAAGYADSQGAFDALLRSVHAPGGQANAAPPAEAGCTRRQADVFTLDVPTPLWSPRRCRFATVDESTRLTLFFRPPHDTAPDSPFTDAACAYSDQKDHPLALANASAQAVSYVEKRYAAGQGRSEGEENTVFRAEAAFAQGGKVRVEARSATNSAAALESLCLPLLNSLVQEPDARA